MNSPTPATAAETDRSAIAEIVRTFFAAFATGPDLDRRLGRLRELFLTDAVIARGAATGLAVYDVEGFIEPRRSLLAGGTLTDFREWQLQGRTDVFGDIAQHFCSYAKEGVQDGRQFTARGMKTMQLVRTAAGWRISAVAWDDERPGLPPVQVPAAV
jgi:hypothetical protein